ncbi:DinB family protein [Tunturibacter empetritectus]|uniref:Damage-inducible protein DinB n=1 Tax=Tunturiibacter lichenicola TaxID=2051959 RepID=A0A7W8J7W4_9BACT|nr:DinB family protein [Edaphobacter lichenicola]MBB5344280.1 putative damage-inducible protein DinB [Edaphobacter lichenicola]
MSQLRELLLAHIGYSAWATRRVLEACSPLTEEQLGRNCGASHSSLLQTFRHSHDGERVWLRRLVEVDNDRLPRGSAPEHSLESLVQTWPELWEGYRRWLEAASKDDLTFVVSTVLPDDAVFRVPRWQIVLHAINHSSFHRGQIVTMLRAFDITPPNTDLTAYYATR